MINDFLGYRLKINNLVFPEKFIERGTYKCIPNKQRLIEEYYDANGNRHIIKIHSGKTSIEFVLLRRTMQTQEQIQKILLNENLIIEYWNDKKMAYDTGNFIINDLEYEHEKKQQGKIVYKKSKIILEEK